MKTATKGNLVIEDIKIGDIHYEYGYGKCIKSRVKSLPVKEEREDDNYWTWESEHINEQGEVLSIINYGVSDKLSHYGPNLYDYEAYMGCKFV